MTSAKDVLKGRLKTMVIIPKGIGIYFLIKDNVIVYVGQSKKVFSRIETHREDPKKDFDTACYFECNKEDLDTFERVFIHAFRPKYNTTYNPSFEPFYYRKPSKSDSELSEAICRRLEAGKFGPSTKRAFRVISYSFPE